MNQKKITAIFKRFAKANPSPTTELVYHSPFELLVAVILSAQATDKGVNKATEKLFKVAPTPEKMATLKVSELENYVKSIGLYKTKAKNILAMTHLLLKEHEGSVPDDREALEALPGVGRKTANVILNTYFNKPTIAVDTHVLRVSNRIGLVNSSKPRQVEDELLRRIPQPFLHHAHHWLILHGRYVCVARKPKCPECIINDLCEYEPKTPYVDSMLNN